MSGILLVRDVMTRGVKTIRPEDTVLEAVSKMNKFHIGSIVVTNNGRPMGIITERDILVKVVEPCMDPASIRAKDVMSKPVITIEPNAAVEEAAKIMARARIKKLPVVEGGKLVGIVTTTDIARASPTHIGIIEELMRVR
jgi:CBS domain-containing protein